MDYYEEQWARKLLRDEYPDQDTDAYAIQYFDSWSSYEENAWMYVLEKDRKLYILRYQYSVMSSDNSVQWDPYETTEEYAIQEMLEFDEACREMDRSMSN